MFKRIIAVILCIFTAVTAFGCAAGSGAADDGYSQLRDKYYFDPYMQGTFLQAWKLNIDDGSILTACPDPLCSHGFADKTCPFSSVIPLEIADAGRYLFYIGKSTDGSNRYSIYSFDTENNSTEKIYTYDKFPSSNFSLMYGEGRLYFDIPRVSDSDGKLVESAERDVMYYDIKTKKIKKYGQKDENDTLLFADKGKVYYRDVKGNVYSTSGAFDESEPLPLPNSSAASMSDYYWECGPGYIARSYVPADIYLYNEKRSVKLPDEAADKILVGLSCTGDTFYFTTETVTNEDGGDGRYTVTVCILDKDGEYRIYNVLSDYNFYVLKGHNDCVVCSILNEYKDGAELIPGTEEENTPNNLMRIDLQSGIASLYNTYSESVLDMRTGDITVKSERVK